MCHVFQSLLSVLQTSFFSQNETTGCHQSNCVGRQLAKQVLLPRQQLVSLITAWGQHSDPSSSKHAHECHHTLAGGTGCVAPARGKLGQQGPNGPTQVVVAKVIIDVMASAMEAEIAAMFMGRPENVAECWLTQNSGDVSRLVL